MIIKLKIFKILEINDEARMPPWLLPAEGAPDRYSAAKNEKLFGTGSGGQRAGLPRGEVVFFGGNIVVYLQKGGLDKKVIGIFCQ